MTRDLILLAVGAGLGGIVAGWLCWVRGYEAGVVAVMQHLLDLAERRGMTLAEIRGMLGVGRCPSRQNEKKNP